MHVTVMEGNLVGSKNNFFLRFLMYCLVQNFIRLIFCASVIMGFFQKLFERVLWMCSFAVHLSMLGKLWASSVSLFWSSCCLRYLERRRMGPLSGCVSIDGHVFLW